MSSTLETLEQQEKKALEKLQAIKARRQALVNREKAKQKEQNERMKLDVKFYWVLTCSRKWKMKQRNKKYSLKSTSI